MSCCCTEKRICDHDTSYRCFLIHIASLISVFIVLFLVGKVLVDYTFSQLNQQREGLVAHEIASESTARRPH